MSNQEQSNPAPVKNLKGLLRFCMEATRSEDAPNSSNPEIFEAMTEDRKKWLEEALTSMTVSPVERMQLCVKSIEEAVPDTEAGTEQQVQAITELQDWAEDLDIAGDFIKINGLRVVPKLLSSEVSELRWRCLELLGNIAQNNPTGQTALLTLKLLPAILMLVDTDPNPLVQVKALYAVSCLVRSNSEAQLQLMAYDGLSVLVRALHSEEEKLRMKATFLMSAICNSNPALKDSLVEAGVIEQLVSLLKEEHDSSHEHILSTMLTIVADHATAQKKCRGLDIPTLLCQKIRSLDGQDQFKEEKDYAEQILEVLNQPPRGDTATSAGTNQLLDCDGF
ncbi:hsp70-binding protein 1-like [Physella acuta]|uniref:hsp70-binding protein 1-like n=1 Tax=Physella acuta TaxID=109671 RepID=UPI0027DE6BA8|nr:hsp70-binding protein 1-like [Physella acuta]